MLRDVMDWGEASEAFDSIAKFVAGRDLPSENEAQTRYDVIDRMIREVLAWPFGMVKVEEFEGGGRAGYVDYLLRASDSTAVVEAKRNGASFPNPTRKKSLKLTGSVLGTGEIAEAILQADSYARSKKADVVVVTNGSCWCFYSAGQRAPDDHATILFPFDQPGDAERLFAALSLPAVLSGSFEKITNTPPRPENRLLAVLDDADGRVDRNSIADHILPALDRAIHADALMSNAETLSRCFVSTEARSKFSSQLGMHLADPKPTLVQPARRIRKERKPGHLQTIVANSATTAAPPVTLIIGPVGAGKSTYLKHFELVSGAQVLSQRQIHWVYIDFERMGKDGSPREFLYQTLRDYLQAEHPDKPTDYAGLVSKAYEPELDALARGPLAPIRNDEEALNREFAQHLKRDFDLTEPYVDKLFRYLATLGLCVLVLDNIDLYEDDGLETRVFAEGLALSKRVLANVIVSVRDKTFVQHRNDSVFNAYELRKLWLDPPPFRAVLSARLSYSKIVLEGRSAKITLPNGMHLNVPDLSVFFDIVQRSILRGGAGDYIESVADLNIRKGLTLVTNFLTSGHIQADRAIRDYLEGNTGYFFPFHEVFKGTMLSQWKHYKERRSDCINLFDSRLGSKKLRLLRLLILNYLLLKAQHEQTVDVRVDDLIVATAEVGAGATQVVETLRVLEANDLVRTTSGEPINNLATVNATRAGGYLGRKLVRRFVYAEECMMDTAIEDAAVWQMLVDLTSSVDHERWADRRMKVRFERIRVFMDYLCSLEANALQDTPSTHFASLQEIRAQVLQDAELAVKAAERHSP